MYPSNNVDIEEERRYYKQLRRQRICQISCCIIVIVVLAVFIRAVIVGGKDNGNDIPSISSDTNKGSTIYYTPKLNPNIDQTALLEACTFLQMEHFLDDCQLSTFFASPVSQGVTIPNSIGILTNLNVLILKDQNLVGTIPSSIGLLTQLTYLHLGSNSFTSGSTIPSTLQHLTNLEYLFIYNITYPLVLDTDDSSSSNNICTSIPAGRNKDIYIDCNLITTTNADNGKCSCCSAVKADEAAGESC